MGKFSKPKPKSKMADIGYILSSHEEKGGSCKSLIMLNDFFCSIVQSNQGKTQNNS